MPIDAEHFRARLRILLRQIADDMPDGTDASYVIGYLLGAAMFDDVDTLELHRRLLQRPALGAE